MLSVARLTYRIHRGEVLVFLALVLATTVAIVVVTSRLITVGPSECLLESSDPSCRSVLDAFNRIRADEASWLMGAGAGLLPVLLGLILGVPLVGRELEVRTAPLAWSLAASRVRWFLQRLLPMGALLLASLILIALLGVLLTRESNPGAYVPRMNHLGSQGLTFIARGLMAFGLAVLAGAVLGRTLPAFLLSALLAMTLALVGSTALAASLAQSWAVWQVDSGYPGYSGDPVPSLLHLREQYRIDEGSPMSESQLYAWFDAQLLDTDWDTWEEQHVTRMELVVPLERFSDFEAAETAAALTIGGTGLLLSFAVVSRRRPT